MSRSSDRPQPRSVSRPDDPNTGYPFYWRDNVRRLRRSHDVTDFARSITYPSRADKDYLVREARRKILVRWVEELPNSGLRVLDVGGRIQPYRALIESRARAYVGVDPVLEGQLDIVAVGEALPFAGGVFDLVVCTQVLGYASSPRRMVEEIHRVLCPSGQLFLSVPAIFPRYHDHCWQFLPAGLDRLLTDFEEVEIVPEGGSVAGLVRSLNMFLDTFVQSAVVRRWLGHAFRVSNSIGARLDPLFLDRNEFAANYCCRAVK